MGELVILVGDNIEKSISPGSARSLHRYYSREWLDTFYEVLEVEPEDITRLKKPAKSKARCLICSEETAKHGILLSTHESIIRIARDHIVKLHPEKAPMESGTHTSLLKLTHQNFQ